jgi:phosphatidylglycerophosphate synthase
MSDVAYHPTERRPLASRDADLARRITARLIDMNVQANAVSLSSIGFAALASVCLIETSSAALVRARILFGLAALFIQLRLLANLLDGMVAVGSRQASPLGELYNEVPDRIADILILVAAGFAAGGTPALGYQAALVAILTAYLRAFGNAVGVRGLFSGPMAKPQRMATITAACVYCACAPVGLPGALVSDWPGSVRIALALIVGGGVLTAIRRLWRIASELRGS